MNAARGKKALWEMTSGPVWLEGSSGISLPLKQPVRHTVGPHNPLAAHLGSGELGLILLEH